MPRDAGINTSSPGLRDPCITSFLAEKRLDLDAAVSKDECGALFPGPF
jgi:hypothetical protein